MGVQHHGRCLYLKLTAVGVFIACLCQVRAWAQDVASFKFTGYEASVSAIVQRDTNNTVTPDSTNTSVSTLNQRQTDVRLETSVMTHSYVYHPKFLSLDMGLGVIEAKNTLESNAVVTDTREPLYNFSLHGSLLPDKPIHGTFFYDRINSTPTINATESFNQRNDKYGFTTTVNGALSPVPVLVDVTREENIGTGSQRSVKELIDRFNISAHKDFTKYGSSDLSYRVVKQDLNNDVAGYPVQMSTQDSQSVSLDTRLRFGTQTNYDINNHIEYSKQKFGLIQGGDSELTDSRFGLDYHGFHPGSLSSFASFQSNRSNQDVVYNDSNAASAGATWGITKDFDVSTRAFASNTQATLFSSKTTGLEASTRYEHPLAIGKGTLNYSARFQTFDQTASNPVTNVIGEQAVVYRDHWVSLRQPNINVSSVNVRVLRYLPQTEPEPIAADFLIEQLGTMTRLRITLTSAVESAEVLVDYSYDNGGTYGSSQLDQSLGLTWTLSPKFNVFARYSDSDPRVSSGLPTTVLNKVNSFWYGLRSTLPLIGYDLIFSGDLDHENRRETLTSYGRTSAELHLSGELPIGIGNDYRVGVRRVHLVADIATQSFDQRAYEMSFGWRTTTGLHLSATGLLERDSEFYYQRDRRSLSVRALWRYRRFSMMADLARTLEYQGLYSRDRSVGRLTLRRDL